MGIPHITLVLREMVHESLHNRWLGRGGSHATKVTDFQPLDFCRWGQMKALARETKVDPEAGLRR